MLEATRSAQKPSKQPNAKTTPECTDRGEKQARNGTNIMHHLSMYPRRGKKSLTMPRQQRPNNSVTKTYEESRAKLKQQIVDTETSSSSNES
ncbi:hypothetical protein Tco_0473518 [Tanacetum coccineum]